MKIYARLPNGKKVFHGDLENGIFKRIIPHHYIRFSDDSFCLNCSVVQELIDRRCQTLEFVWLKKSCKEVYRIEFPAVIEQYKIVTNEYNERNYRIPIQDCWLLNRIIKKVEPPVILHGFSQVVETKENIQQTLF